MTVQPIQYLKLRNGKENLLQLRHQSMERQEPIKSGIINAAVASSQNLIAECIVGLSVHSTSI